MVQSALLAAMLAVCAWIALPIPPVAVTMQTFGVLLTLGLLGGKWGTGSILLYLLLGSVGLPVFSGFRGGIGVLLDVTGGFLWGFFLGGLAYWALERIGKLPAMIACLVVTYACGSFWFSVYAGNVGIAGAVLTCVIPYLVPDGMKLALAYGLSCRIAKHISH